MNVLLAVLLAALPVAYLLGHRHGCQRARVALDGRLRELARIESLRSLPPAAPGRPRPPARRR